MSGKPWIVWILAGLSIAGCSRPAGPSESAGAKDEHGHASKTDKKNEDGGHLEDERIELTSEQVKIAGIQTAVAERRFMQTELTVPGIVRPTNDAVARVTPPVPGRIIRLMVSVGDPVRPGQPLAVVQSPDLASGTGAIAEAETRLLAARAAVREASAQIDLAHSRQRSAEQTLRRQRSLAREGVFSQPSLQAAQNEVGEAQTELAASRSEIAARQNVLGRAERLFSQGLVAGAEVDQARVDLEQARIRLERADQRIQLAERTLEREGRVNRSGLLNAREIQTAEAEVRASRLEVERERIALRSAQAGVQGATRAVQNARASASALRGGGPGDGSAVTLTAPIGGVITERNATLGQAVERSSDLFEIQNLNRVFVTASIPERNVGEVKIGARVRVTTDAAPDRAFAGTIRLIGNQLDAKTRSLPVQVLVQNPRGILRPEGFARATLSTKGGQTVLAIPRSAVVGNEEAPIVFVQESGKYEHREVKLGRTAGHYVEVLSGIAEGETVVVKGAFTLLGQRQKGELKGHEH